LDKGGLWFYWKCICDREKYISEMKKKGEKLGMNKWDLDGDEMMWMKNYSSCL
jgi:hypothetical protein